MTSRPGRGTHLHSQREFGDGLSTRTDEKKIQYIKTNNATRANVDAGKRVRALKILNALIRFN